MQADKITVLRDGFGESMTVTQATDLTLLRREVERMSTEADAEIGVCIRHVQSGDELTVHPDSLYPLASVVKIPILIEALAQVDEGRLALETRYPLRPEDKLPPSGVLVELDYGLAPTLRDLLTLMIIISDNTATDMVLGIVGSESVEQRLRGWGIEAISVKLGVGGLFEATFPVPEGDTPMGLFRKLAARGPLHDPMTGKPAAGAEALSEFTPNWEALPGQRTLDNNVSSPADMGRLLERLVRVDLLSDRCTGVALDILLRQQLNARIPRYLPRNVPVAHKTGTFLQTRNDAGILYLPNGEHVIVVTFALLRRDLLEADPLVSTPYIDRVDGAMGRIARAAYDAFAPMEAAS
jgi:beta-lactamase class A